MTVALAALAGAPAALAAPGDIFTVAGTSFGLSGDNGAATAAQLSYPTGVAATADGGFLIADIFNHRVRKVSAAGTITTVAGTTPGLSGDGGPATAAQLRGPLGVAVTADGGFLIADTGNQRVRKVSPAGTISTVAGTTYGLSGDNGAATAAQLKNPTGVAATADGGFLIADNDNDRVRKVSPAGTITTVAGTTTGLSGDGGAATAARLDSPGGVAVTANGGFLIADTLNERVRKVSAAGTITTVAGTTPGLSGDGGLATAARLYSPNGVAVTADGGFLIADTGNDRVRKVSAAGTITTVAGTTYGLSGDGGPATAAQLKAPEGVAATADGGFLIADEINKRVRKVGPSAALAGSPTSVRVSKTGRLTYRFVATPAASGTITFTSTKRVKIGSHKRELSFAKAFTAPASGKVVVKLKLSRKHLKALKHAKHLRFRVTVSLAAKTFTTKVTLKAPKKT